MFQNYRGIIFACLVFVVTLSIGLFIKRSLKSTVVTGVQAEQSGQDAQTSVKIQITPQSSSEGSNDLSLTDDKLLEEKIRSFIINNPEIIETALDLAHQKKLDEQKRQINEMISQKKEEIKDSKYPVMGNPKGKNIVVVFYDYSCGYCRQSFEVLKKLIPVYPDLKIILRPYPILGNESDSAARLATAAQILGQDKFDIIHKELLSNRSYDKDELVTLFKETGVDISQIEDMKYSKEVDLRLSETSNLAKEMHINGVPVFIINEQYFPGFLTLEQITEILNPINNETDSHKMQGTETDVPRSENQQIYNAPSDQVDSPKNDDATKAGAIDSGHQKQQTQDKVSSNALNSEQTVNIPDQEHRVDPESNIKDSKISNDIPELSTKDTLLLPETKSGEGLSEETTGDNSSKSKSDQKIDSGEIYLPFC
ncbi:MAG: DsbA family protein [Rickettsiaceae bacterium]|nr:DsbA family protein [Rickettsiaceae bacterium]